MLSVRSLNTVWLTITALVILLNFIFSRQDPLEQHNDPAIPCTPITVQQRLRNRFR